MQSSRIIVKLGIDFARDYSWTRIAVFRAAVRKFPPGRIIMASVNRSTVVGVFEDRIQADKAVAELQSVGFRNDQIGVAMRHTEGEQDSTLTEDSADTHAAAGAGIGVLTGLGLGALAGLGVLSGVIPVIGPAIAAGTLGVVMSNAAVGAGIVGLVGALVGAGIPEDEARYYHDEFKAGRVIVTVDAPGRTGEATAILHRFGAYDINTRGYDAASNASTVGRTTTRSSSPRSSDSGTL
jgi:hypothetical protein